MSFYICKFHPLKYKFHSHDGFQLLVFVYIRALMCLHVVLNLFRLNCSVNMDMNVLLSSLDNFCVCVLFGE